jgi:Peptidase family M28
MRFPLFAALWLLLAACASPEINQERVERIISTLASDDMRGRGAFTEDGWRAAGFIADEFADIGMETFADDDDFLQEFAIYSVSTTSLDVTLNGVPAARAIGNLSADISWSDADDLPVSVVGPDRDLVAAWRLVRGSDALLVVHPDHAETFGRLGAFLSRPSRAMSRTGGASLVMVESTENSIGSFTVQGHVTSDSTMLTNVVGVVPGRRTDEVVLFSAHYDHIGVRPGETADTDSIANGANDDASGTAAVIELARYFKDMGRQERTMVFAAFTAEESGGYGSRYFSSQLNPDQIVAMFNVEMIGKGAVEGPNTAWITGFERSDFGPILQEAVQGTEFRFYPDPYPDQNLFYRSDNATLARLGVPAHSISTTPIDVDPDYHQVTDEVGTLDLTHLTNTIKAIAAGASTIVSGQATPSRIDPQTVNR